jgi:hypothetical protein
VIGRRFSRAAVLDLSPTDTPASDVRFRSLIQKGLIRRAAGEGLLAFQHVLVRNVVYAGIPKGVRGDLHQRAAAWFEERHPDLIELDEIVGYHLEQAAHYKQELGQPDQALAERAGERLAAAGRRALWRGDNPAARSLFERALERTRPFGLDVHLELDLAWAHRNTNQAVALADAVAKQAAEARDEPGEMLAHLAVAQYGLDFAQDDNVDELEAIAHAALPLLERAEDHAGLVHVWFALGFGVANERCQYEAWTHAAEQALRHAHLAGQVTGHLFGLDYALLQGPRPADEALRVLDATVSASAPPSVLGSRAWLLAMLGRFDEAWQIAHAQSARGRDLNPETSIDDRLAGIAQLTGNEEAAAGYLRGFCDWCEERGLRGRLSTYAPELGSTLCALGRFDEAEPLAELGRELAAEQDASAQMLWRQVKARVLASRGEVERAEHLARAAVAISERTDALNYQGDALSDLAEVLHSAGQSEEATATLARSLERFERKRNLAMAERVRVRLNDYRQSTIPAKET